MPQPELEDDLDLDLDLTPDLLEEDLSPDDPDSLDALDDDELPPDNLEDDLPETPAPKSRGSARIQRLTNENRKLQQRLDRLEGVLDDRSRTPAPSAPDPRISERQEAELLATMTVPEQVAYYRDKDRKEITQAFAITNANTNERLDRIAFRELCRDDPHVRAVAAEVEQRKVKFPHIDRELLANQIIAERLRNGSMKKLLAVQKKKADAARRQKVNPPNSGGGAAPERGGDRGKPTTAKERLLAAEAKGLKPLSMR